MTNAKKVAFAGILTAAAVLSACRDERPDKAIPTAPKLVLDANGALVMGACTDLATLNTLAAQVFGAGSPNVNSVLGKLDNLNKKVQAGDTASAQAQANNIVQFVRAKAVDGRLAGSSAIIDSFINSVLCFAGLSANTYLIQPSDQPQLKIASDSLSGVSLPASPVAVPTLLTITTLSPTGPSPLITELDKYPTYTDIQLSSPLVGTAIVAVCPSANVPSDVRPRLRLGHQATAGFELTPKADGSFLPCNPPAASLSQSRVPRWLRNVASIFMPRALYARQFLERGVGGLASEFSPFGAVDPLLELRGVGGLASEFKKTGPTTPGVGSAATGSAVTGSTAAGSAAGVGATTSRKPTSGVTAVTGGTAANIADPCATTVSTDVSAACRPLIIVTTHLGVVMVGVPVLWSVDSGGGTIAPETLSPVSCGASGSSTTTVTDANGKAGVCWKVGPNGGGNTVTAIPSAGGSAPLGVTFTGPLGTGTHGLRYRIEGLKAAATISLTALTPTYDGTPKGATATTLPAGLNVVSLTYSSATYPASTTAPTAAGTYTVVATLTNSSYAAPDVTSALVIAKAAQTALVPTGPTTGVFGQSITLTATGGSGGGALAFDAGVSAACTVGATDGRVAVTSGTGTCAITITKAGDDNYGPVSATVTITVSKANQTITIGALGAKTFGDLPFAVSATASSSLAVSFAAVGGCTVAGGTVTITGAGNCTVTATQTGNDNYNAATAVTQSFAIAKAAGSLGIAAPASLGYLGTGNITPTVTGDGVVSYSVTSGPCSLTGPVVTMNSGTGSCTVGGSLTEGANYLGASATAVTILASKAHASLLLSNLGPYTYDLGSKSATVTTTPPSLTGVSVTYNGSATAPAAAATYAVVASLTNDNFEATNATGSLVINKALQATLTVTGPTSATYGAGTFAMGTSGGTGSGALTYSATGGACAVNATTGVASVTNGTGACSITASKAEEANYAIATSAAYPVTINKADQTITFGPLASKTYLDPSFTVTATTSSPLTVTFTAIGNCTVAGTSAAITGAGSCTVTASQGGNGNYNAATAVAQSFAIAKAAGSLSITGPASVGYLGTGNITPTVTGDGVVSYSVTSGPCSLAGPVVTMDSGTGSCSVRGTLTEGTNYVGATSNVLSISATKAGTSLVLGGLGPYTYDATPKSATATTSPAGLTGVAITYNGAATLPLAAGDYAVAATLSNDNYSALPAAGTLTITKAPQATLTVTGPTSATYGAGTFAMGTSGGTGSGALTYSATGGACAVNATTGVASVTNGTGACSITASKAEEANYADATSAAYPVTINKGSQTITFGSLIGRTYGDAAVPVSATASSGLGVTFAASGNCTYGAGNVTITGAGNCTVTADQSGDGNFNPALSVPQTFLIAAAPTTTSVSCLVSPSFTGSALTPCTASVTGPAGLNTALTPGYLANTNAGLASATATFDATVNYLGSTDTKTFQINLATSTTAVTCSAPPFAYTAAAIAPCAATATGAGSLSAPVTTTYTANVNVGSVTASATFAGDANHSASTGSTAFSITPASTLVTLTCPASVPYSGATLNPCTASVAGPGLAQLVAVAYLPSLVRDAGNYSATASYAGGGNYSPSPLASGGFTVTKRSATATAGNATINFGATVPTIPCTVSGLLGVDAGSVTCTSSASYTIAGSYPVTPIVTPASLVNYTVGKTNGTLTVAGYVQVGCFASPLTTTPPPKTVTVRKGSNLPVKCALFTSTGAAVTNATGWLTVEDRGTGPTLTPTTPFAFGSASTSVFKLDNNKNYVYGLDTSDPRFIAGNYYVVTAFWNDGSKTSGWFIMK